MNLPTSLFVNLILWSLFFSDSFASSVRNDASFGAIAKGLRGSRRSSNRWTETERITAEVHESGEKCSLDASVSCQVHHGQGIVEACEDFSLPLLTVAPCEQTPLTTTLLYNGGDCLQTDNQESLRIQCQDGSTMSPPTDEGAMSYIVVMDAQAQGLIYHANWVAVGSTYVLGNGAEMNSGFVVYIYDSADQTNLLQQASYGSSLCSTDLEFLNRFGASQIIEYTNEEQGIVSPFASFSYDVRVDLTFKVMGAESASMTGATVLSNFASFTNLSNEVQGHIVEKENPVTISLPAQLDLTEPRRNTMLVQATASLDINSSDNDCTLTTFLSFFSGGRKQG